MAGQSERTKMMKANFMNDREIYSSMVEIAEKYQLSVFTVYDNLQDIADENGVSRDSLLFVVHKEHEVGNKKIQRKGKEINPEELKKDFEILEETVQSLREKIHTILNQQEED